MPKLFTEQLGDTLSAAHVVKLNERTLQHVLKLQMLLQPRACYCFDSCHRHHQPECRGWWRHLNHLFIHKKTLNTVTNPRWNQSKWREFPKKENITSGLITTIIALMSFGFPPPCRLHSPPSPPRVAAQEAPVSRHNTGNRIIVAPPGIIMIRFLPWSRREVEVRPIWFQHQSPGLVVSAATHPDPDPGVTGFLWVEKGADLGPRQR